MAYDNAELLAAYAIGWMATREPLFRETMLDTIRFLSGVLSDPSGGFYGSQDADVGLHDDGDYFTWTVAEVDAALPADQAEVVKLRYHVHAEGEMHHDPARNVLFASLSPQEIARRVGKDPAEVERLLESGMQDLLRARAARHAPAVDATLYVNWNGLCISAFCRACRALAASHETDPAIERVRADLLHDAYHAFNRLWVEAFDPARGFAHVLGSDGPRVWGLLDDQVKMGLAALDLFELTGHREILEQATAIANIVRRDYEDVENGGFFDVRAGEGGEAAPLAERQKPIEDDPLPSANGTAAQLFLRLALLTGSDEHRDTARRTLLAFRREAQALAHHTTAYLLALDAYLAPQVRAIVAGARGSEAGTKLLETAWSTWRPYAAVHPLEPAEVPEAGLPPELPAMLASAERGRPMAYVCAGTACAPPTSDPAELARVLHEFGRETAG
jgi:hypothetical protein